MMDISVKRSDLLAPENRTFAIMNVLLMPAMINILIACVLANFLFPPGTAVFIWGPSSMIIDLLISSFMASLITGLIAFYTALAAGNKGLLRLSLPEYRSVQPIRGWLKPWPGNLIFALISILATSLILAAFVLIYDQDSISWLSFLWIKSIQALLVSVYASVAGTCLAIHQIQLQQIQLHQIQRHHVQRQCLQESE